jgi:hypothetical protein
VAFVIVTAYINKKSMLAQAVLKTRAEQIQELPEFPKMFISAIIRSKPVKLFNLANAGFLEPPLLTNKFFAGLTYESI